VDTTFIEKDSWEEESIAEIDEKEKNSVSEEELNDETPEIDNRIPDPEVTITYKKSKPVNFEIDLDALTWEDTLLFGEIESKTSSGEMTEKEGFEALSDLISKIVGQDVRSLPSRHVGAIIAEISNLSSSEPEKRKN